MVTTQLSYMMCSGRLIITAQLRIINTSKENREVYGVKYTMKDR
jgi:hypothetical protein